MFLSKYIKFNGVDFNFILVKYTHSDLGQSWS